MNFSPLHSHPTSCPLMQHLTGLGRSLRLVTLSRERKRVQASQDNETSCYSSLHSSQTTKHQNSLLLMLGEGLGMRVENTASSRVTAENSSFLETTGEDILDHKMHLLDSKTHLLDHKMHLRAWSLRAESLRAWSQLHPYKIPPLEASA